MFHHLGKSHAKHFIVQRPKNCDELFRAGSCDREWFPSVTSSDRYEEPHLKLSLSTTQRNGRGSSVTSDTQYRLQYRAEILRTTLSKQSAGMEPICMMASDRIYPNTLPLSWVIFKSNLFTCSVSPLPLQLIWKNTKHSFSI